MRLAFLPLFCPLQNRTTPEESVLEVKGASEWHIRRYRTAADLRKYWPDCQRQDDFWLRPSTLSFLFDQPQGMNTEAIVLENQRDLRRVLLTAQTFSFSAAGQVSDAAKGETSRYDLRRRLLAPFSFKILCLGQFLTSGTFCQDGLRQLSAPEAARVLPAVADALMSCGLGYAAVLYKDLFPTLHPAVRELQQGGAYLLPVDPVMQINLPAEWSTVADYLGALTSKYRVRYRRARAKLAGLQRRRLSIAEVDYYQELMYQLYRNTSSGADFNAAELTSAYFPWLARTGVHKRQRQPTLIPEVLTDSSTLVPEATFGETYIYGYFNEANELVGFTTAIPNGPVLHAHYLGLRDAYKYSHHLYHNMLFDLLETGIEGGFRTLDYGRTALEIKSSVGAGATDYACLLRTRNGFINRLVPIFTPAVYRAQTWKARNPFKQ